MGLVTGNNLTIYAGDDMNVIGCEESCTITVTTEEIITTTKGSGRGTNREYGRYDATLSATGVIFMYADEATAAAANRQDPLYFHSYIIQGKKVCAKYQFTDGVTTKYVIANWIVRNAVYTGQSGDFATFDIELSLDGQLYETTAMRSGATYDGPSIYIYEATSTVDNFIAPELEDLSRVYFLIKNGVVFENVTVTTIAGVPIDPTEIAIGTSNGGVYFGTDIINGDIILISYDPAD